MSFKVLKLITEENIIADVYKRRELEEFLGFFEESTVLDELRLIGDKTTLILLDPMIIEEVHEKNRITTIINAYLPYSTNELLAIPERNILHISEPKKQLLQTYNDYILEVRQKEIISSAQQKLQHIAVGSKLTIKEMVTVLRLLTSTELPH